MIKIKNIDFKNDAIFYYYFKDKINLLKIIISKVFNISTKNITEIKVLNSEPYLDSVYNKYNVLYIQGKANNKYIYLIINNLDSGININYVENYMLNVELTEKYNHIFSENIGIAHNIYFVNSKNFPYKKCLAWKLTATKEIINFDFKYIFNINKINEENDVEFKKILYILKYGTPDKMILSNNILEEAVNLKRKRKNIVVNSNSKKSIDNFLY